MMRYDTLLLTAVIGSFLMLATLIALAKGYQDVAMAAIAALMSILSMYVWKMGGKDNEN